MSVCFVKIDKVTFVAKTALVYEFYFNFNKCQSRQTLIHQEQNLLHISIFESQQPLAITYIIPRYKKQGKFYSK